MIKYFFIVFLLFSCVPDFQHKELIPYYILHDNSSKVWIINHLYKNGSDQVPLSVSYKKMIVFHASRNCYVYKLSNIKENQGRKASFFIENENKELRLEFNNETWSFYIQEFSEEKIKLKSKDENNSYTLELVSFPEM
jgi:hypothetical protein